jgi:hypothetical protein
VNTNRADDPQYIVRLIGRMITVSLETVRIVKPLPALRIKNGRRELMLNKKYRELNDGLGTVLIGLELSPNRLTALQAQADARNTSVDTVINEAISLHLIQLDNEQRKGQPPVETLIKENRVLKQVISGLAGAFEQKPTVSS